MSNGYLAAATADKAVADEIGYGLELDVVTANVLGTHESAANTMAQAANVGLILSHAAMRDAAYVALLQALAGKLSRAQLIVVEPDAANAFAFLPSSWPVMQLDEALRRAHHAATRRAGPVEEPPVHAAPLPAEPPAPPAPEPEPEVGQATETEPPPEAPKSYAPVEEPAEADETPPVLADEDSYGGEEAAEADATKAPEDEPVAAAPAPQAPPIQEIDPEAPSRAITIPRPAAEQQSTDDGVMFGRDAVAGTVGGRYRAQSLAPADATAFAPKKLRRATPELVRITIHQPKDLQAVIRAARQADPRTDSAPQSMGMGDIEIGSTIGVALEVKGAACDGALQQRTWRGEPIDFSYVVEADEDARQVVILARVFVNDAQIGVLAFTRGVSGPAKKPHGDGERVRLHRFKRVFISYSSADRETVSTIATAYEMAGVPHFFDRTSLKSGEEWSPRLKKEIEKADLFHLCWSKAAAKSEWVEKEAEFALERHKKSKGKQPSITVQMLDGPPWAPHPAHLDAINFDDFVRAAIVGYARGEG
ncbi:toll/interleukin-1 receptor domain-containing protein [Terricaulis sp.]|uniref:toll/interleukin-1 receptor domain-containing protein n=1 Tax=Terricaulis sp. TaxID=2768686 RepID=UPI003783DE6D